MACSSTIDLSYTGSESHTVSSTDDSTSVKNRRKQSNPTKIIICEQEEIDRIKKHQETTSKIKQWYLKSIAKRKAGNLDSQVQAFVELDKRPKSCPTRIESGKFRMASRLSTWSTRLGQITSRNQPMAEAQSACQQQEKEQMPGSFSIKLRLMPMDMKRGLIKREMTTLKSEMNEALNMMTMIFLGEEKELLRSQHGMTQTTSYLKIHWLQTFNRMIQEGNLPTGSLITRMMTANVITHHEAGRAMDVLRMIRLICPAYSRVVYLQTEMLRDLVSQQNQS
ncbi:accessory protein [melian virus]|uniref:Accessory protein n=1 Tax=melian virus TaxID=2940995 RepID=A0AAE9KX96_9MONO|nr:accessory protein [melian virus]